MKELVDMNFPKLKDQKEYDAQERAKCMAATQNPRLLHLALCNSMIKIIDLKRSLIRQARKDRARSRILPFFSDSGHVVNPCPM